MGVLVVQLVEGSSGLSFSTQWKKDMAVQQWYRRAIIWTVSEREDSELSIVWINLQNTNNIYINFQKEIPLVLI